MNKINIAENRVIGKQSLRREYTIAIADFKMLHQLVVHGRGWKNPVEYAFTFMQPDSFLRRTNRKHHRCVVNFDFTDLVSRFGTTQPGRPVSKRPAPNFIHSVRREPRSDLHFDLSIDLIMHRHRHALPGKFNHAEREHRRMGTIFVRGISMRSEHKVTVAPTATADQLQFVQSFAQLGAGR